MDDKIKFTHLEQYQIDNSIQSVQIWSNGESLTSIRIPTPKIEMQFTYKGIDCKDFSEFLRLAEKQARLEAFRKAKQAIEQLREDRGDCLPSDQVVGFMYCIEAIDNLITQAETE